MTVGKRKKKLAPDAMRSKFEVTIFKQLQALQKATDIESIDYETEKLKYVIEHEYIPDFIIKLTNGDKIYIEAKGYFRPEDRRKLIEVRKANPGYDIRLVFQANSKIHRLSPTRYSDWAEKSGFTYSIGSIPKEWFQ